MFPKKTDILSALAPLVYASKLGGLSQMSVTDFYRDKTVKLSHILINIFNIFQTIFLAIVGCQMIINTMLLKTDKTSELSTSSQLTGVVITWCNIVLMIIHVCMAIFSRESFIKIIEDLNDLHLLFKCKNFKGKDNYTNIFYFTAVIVIQMLLSSTGVAFFTSMDGISEGLYGFVEWISYFMPYFVNTVVRMWYMAFNNIISCKLKTINDYLVDMTKELDKIPQKSENVRQKFTPRKVTLKNIDEICDIHYSMCEILKNVNAVYSTEMLLTTGYIFIVLTTQLYFTYIVVVWNDHLPGFDETENPATILVWIISLVTETVVLSANNSRVIREVKRTAVELHGLANAIDKEEIHSKVNHVSIKMLNHVVKLTAGGFFAMDMTAIYSMSGSVASYLIILIQFDLAGRKSS